MIRHQGQESVPPIVSVGMPVFNGEDFITESIESLLSQTFSDFELIISDNCSTDRTESIIDDYVKRDKRIRYIRQDRNIGAIDNFCFVLNEAKGRFFMWATHDDIWAENWIDMLVQNIDSEDVGIRGAVKFLRENKISAEKTLPNLKQMNLLQYFMRDESDYRSHYTYSLYIREKILNLSKQSLYLDYYPDLYWVYQAIKLGNLRCISGTYNIYRIHGHNAGGEYSRRWKGIAKIIYRIHPFRFYKYYFNLTDGVGRKLILLLLMPVKHVYAQLRFWYRGIMQIITRKKFI